MQYSPVNIFALLAPLLLSTLTSLVSGSPTAKREILMPDHAVYPTWTFTASDGTEHTVEGTITDYLTKREAIDPTFKRNPKPVRNETSLAERLAARAKLEPRNIISPPNCIPNGNWGWGKCSYLDILDTQDELIANNQRPNVPCCQWGNCAMIYCLGGISVWICNDVRLPTPTVAFRATSLIF
jgi:hypothetical protein